jgi:hypothetical protein
MRCWQMHATEAKPAAQMMQLRRTDTTEEY